MQGSLHYNYYIHCCIVTHFGPYTLSLVSVTLLTQFTPTLVSCLCIKAHDDSFIALHFLCNVFFTSIIYSHVFNDICNIILLFITQYGITVYIEIAMVYKH